MTWFSARTVAWSHVPVSPEPIWRVLTDPSTLAALTPLVRSIEPDGEHWRWTLHGIDGLGIRAQTAFTEQMDFIDGRRIAFTPAPPPGAAERAAIDGVYTLEATTDGGCRVAIDLTARVDLPLPGLARRSVEALMGATMRSTGDRFATNLYEHLGLDPADAKVERGDTAR
jgi:carbon monoxide dehydrogenase subunit G